MHADQPQFCCAYRLMAWLCGSEQFLVSMGIKTKRFPSSLGIQHKVGWSMGMIWKTRSIPVRSASAEEEHGRTCCA